MCYQKHKWKSMSLVQMLKIEKTVMENPFLTFFKCMNACMQKKEPSTHTYTQARFTHNTSIYHIHADRRWNSEKGTTQEGFSLKLLQGERRERLSASFHPEAG